MFGESAISTANTGLGKVTTANANLDGTGTLGTVLTAADNGTYIKTVTIKTQSNINEGVVRLFITQGANTFLLMEIVTPIAGKSGTFASYSRTVYVNYFLKSGCILKASTQETKTFSVIAEGYTLSYP